MFVTLSDLLFKFSLFQGYRIYRFAFLTLGTKVRCWFAVVFQLASHSGQGDNRNPPWRHHQPNIFYLIFILIISIMQNKTKKRVLIVDDDPDILAIYKQGLEDYGLFEV